MATWRTHYKSDVLGDNLTVASAPQREGALRVSRARRSCSPVARGSRRRRRHCRRRPWSLWRCCTAWHAGPSVRFSSNLKKDAWGCILGFMVITMLEIGMGMDIIVGCIPQDAAHFQAQAPPLKPFAPVRPQRKPLASTGGPGPASHTK